MPRFSGKYSDIANDFSDNRHKKKLELEQKAHSMLDVRIVSWKYITNASADTCSRHFLPKSNEEQLVVQQTKPKRPVDELNTNKA